MTSTRLSNPSAPSEAADQLVGSQTPRIWTPRDPDLDTHGPILAKIADLGGIELDPWQHLVADCSLEVLPDGTWAHRGVCLLVARQNGKTVILKARVLAGLFAFDDRLILHTAQDRAVPREMFEGLVEIIERTPAFRRRIGRRGIREANGQERITLVDGSTYRILAPRAAAFRTWSADLLIFDEIREQKDWGLWGAALPTQRARPSPQWWAASNAGDADSVVLRSLVDRGRKAADEPGSDPRICYLEWSAAGGEDRPIDDPAAWAEANPSLGIRLTAETVTDELAALPEGDFRVEVLCQMIEAAIDPAIPPAAWADAGGYSGQLETELPRPVMGVDVNGDRTRAAATIAARRGDRIIVDTVAEWTDLDDGLDMNQIASEVWDWMKAHKIKDLAYDARNAGHIGAVIDRKAGTRTQRMTSTDFVLAGYDLFDAVTTRTLWHRDDPALTGQILKAAKKSTGDDGWYISRSASPEAIPAVISLAFAVHLAYRPTVKPKVHTATSDA